MAFSPQVAQEILRKMDWKKKKKKIREALTLCSGEILLRIIVLLIEVAVPLLLAY